jgi:hypothetical protein
MMKKKLTFDFFQVIMPKDSSLNLGSILSQISTLTGKQQLDTMGDYPIRLHSLNNTTPDFLGDIARIRMDDIPPKMKLSGETNPLGLDDDEGLGEISSFIFHPTTNVLMLMRNRNAVGISAFCRYIETFGKIEGVQFRHVFHPDVYKRLQRLDTIKKMELDAAGPGSGTIFRDLEVSAGAMADIMGISPRVHLRLAFSTGYDRKVSLPKAAILKIAAAFQKRGKVKDESISLVISGKEENALQKEVIDLFEDVLTDYFVVDVKGQRVITDNHRHQATKAVWARHKDNLIKLLPKE